MERNMKPTTENDSSQKEKQLVELQKRKTMKAQESANFEVDALKRSIAECEKKLTVEKEGRKAADAEVSKLKERNFALQEEITVLNNKLEDLQGEISRLNSELFDVQNQDTCKNARLVSLSM